MQLSLSNTLKTEHAQSITVQLHPGNLASPGNPRSSSTVKKGQRKKSTYTGAHVSDHISRDHWAIFKLQLRREREIGFSDPRWYSVRNNMTNTNAQNPNPPDWRTAAEDAEALPYTELIPLAHQQNPADRSDISNQGIHPQLCSKSADTSKRVQTLTHSSPQVSLSSSSACTTHHFLPTSSLCSREDRRCTKQHSTPQFCVSSCMLFTQDTPKYLCKACLAWDTKQGPVQ